VTEPQFYKIIARLKMAYVEHVLRGSNGNNAVLVLEGKVNGVRRGWKRKKHGSTTFEMD